MGKLLDSQLRAAPRSPLEPAPRLRDRLRRCLDWPCRRAGSEFIRDLNNDPSLRKRPVDSEIRCR